VSYISLTHQIDCYSP